MPLIEKPIVKAADSIFTYAMAWFIGGISFIYLMVLSAKSYTWVFASEDAADWLASSILWFVPQPVGSPLYILLGHAINVLPIDLVSICMNSSRARAPG